MKQKPVAFIALAVIFIMLALFRVSDSVRAVDIVSLLGAGILAGVLLMTGIQHLRNQA
ncbi:MAG: hypothetical protein AAF490_31165 [Chloroflexota bacterium]